MYLILIEKENHFRMKKILAIIFLLIIVGSQTACKKFLETTPTSFIAPQNYYNNPTDLQNALNSVYSGLSSSAIYGNNWLSLNWSTDEMCNRNSTPSFLNYFYTSSEPTIYSFWQTAYQGISNANYLLANINKPLMDSTSRTIIQGQALFLRGYYYFLLVSNFGDVPLILNPIEDGSNNLNVKKTAKAVVYQQILADMKLADTLLQNQTVKSLGYSGKITKTAIEGILARVCLFMAGHPVMDVSKYNDALFYINKVIMDGEHSLNPSYSQIFINYAADKYDTNESIWEIEFSGTSYSSSQEGQTGVGYGISCNDLTIGLCYGQAVPTSKLFRLYGVDSTSLLTPKACLDTRRDWNCANYSWGSANTGTKTLLTNIYQYGMGKFRREYEVVMPKSKNFSPENFPVLRYADILLMQAEAENELNGPTAIAYNAINQVRRRGFGFPLNVANVISDVPSGLSKSAFRSFIQDERARELCGETLRRLDLIRWGLLINNVQGLLPDISVNYPSGVISLGLASKYVSQKDTLFPIPSTEMSVNKLLVQNGGW